MLNVFVASFLPIIVSIMAYIAYKYPFNGKKGQITKWGRFFGFLVVLSILSGIYLAWDSYFTSNNAKIEKEALKTDIKNILNKIDKIGYKIDKTTGNLIPKKETIVAPKVVIKYVNKEKVLTEKNISDLSFRIDSLQKSNGVKREIFIGILPYCNAPSIPSQVLEMAKKAGFKIHDFRPINAIPDSPQVNGIKIRVDHPQGISIVIGHFK